MIDLEEDFLLPHSGMYASVYNPSGPGAACREQSIVLFVPPLFEEMPRTRKVLVELARAVAGSGSTAVRFDYRGTGLSRGRFEDVTLASMREDVASMMDMCRQRGASRIALFGFRFGGYLAAELMSNALVSRVVLWEPLLDLGTYFRQMLRMEVANQLVTIGEILDTQDSLLSRLRSGGSILIDGYRVSSGLAEQFSAAPTLSLEAFKEAEERVELLLWEGRQVLSRATELGLAAQLVKNVRFSWQNIRFLQPRHEGLFSETLGAMSGRGVAAEQAS